MNKTKKHSLTIYDIKERTKETSPYFFTREPMKFFGQTMKDFNVTKRANLYRITAPIRDNGELIGHTIRYFDPNTNELSLPLTKEIEGKSLLDDKRDIVSISLNRDQKKKAPFITEGLPRFDKAKNQLKADVLKYYGEAAGWKRWNKIDHLKPIYILDHFPEIKAKLPTARINELQVISDEGRQEQNR